MESATKKVKLTIDGKEVHVDEGITILDAARQEGIYIPTLCHHPALSSWGGCRICVVQVDGAPRLAASCVTPVREGMDVVTSNEAIIQSRRLILEFLFAERNHNCMFCPQSGDCELQKLAYELQMDHLTVSFSFNTFETDSANEYMAIDHNRCILCGRCVRACRELAGAYVLNYQNRGPQSLIGFDLAVRRDQSGCDSSGVCMQVCPTGALSNRYRSHYAVKGHDADWDTKHSVCPQCGILCPTTVFVKNNVLVKVEGHLDNGNGRPDRGQLCYKGRFDILKSKGQRLVAPLVKNDNGEWEEVTWDAAIERIEGSLKKIRERNGPKAVFGIIAGSSSNEELVSFREFMVEGLSGAHLDSSDGESYRALAAVRTKGAKPYREASWKEVAQADMTLIIGVDPHEHQPIISALARRNVVEQGAAAVVIGATDVLQPWTSWWLRADAGKMADVTRAFLCTALSAGLHPDNDKDLQSIKAAAGNDKGATILAKIGYNDDTQRQFNDAVSAFVNARNPIVITGCAPEGNGWLAPAFSLALLKGLLPEETMRLVVVKENGNSAAAWKLGLAAPTKSPRMDDWKGGLLVMNGEDTTSGQVPDSLEFLAICTPYYSEDMKERAHVLLPKPLWFEESGTYSSLDGRETKYKKRVLVPPPGVPESWKIWDGMLTRISGTLPFPHWEDVAKKAENEMRG